MKIILSTLILSISFIFSSCKKDGLGGKSSIEASIEHHGKSIPGATLYVKYGAKEFPGNDLSVYNQKLTAPLSGSLAAKVSIENLLKGDYFLYAIGYDSAISQAVSGGIYVKLISNDEEKQVVVPVTE